MIDGAKERMDGKADATKGLQVIDKNTVQITLAAPFAPFLAGLATPGVGIWRCRASRSC